jgi:hypothetical protein
VKYTGELDTAGVWFVIDCSVPVDGQFESIRLLSKIYAQELRSLRHTKSDFKHKSDTMIASTHTFKDGTPRIIQNRFPKSSLPAALLNDDATSLILSSMAVHIDLFGNSNSQINKSERLLKAHHKQLVARRIGKPPTMDRLWLRLASTKGRAVGSPTDGNRLKAYVLLAELDMNGISVGTEIVDELTKLGMGSKGSIKQTPDIWTDFVSTSNRSSRFEKYLSEAKKFCSQDYKWLIHTQNPPREALAD